MKREIIELIGYSLFVTFAFLAFWALLWLYYDPKQFINFF